MKDHHPSYEERAIEKLQEADLWWLGFDRAINTCRSQMIYLIAMKAQLRAAISRGASPSVLGRIREAANFGHDMMLSSWDDVRNLARSAVSCEMAARIYYEEEEEQHWRDNE